MEHDDQLRKMFANVNDWLKFAEAKNLGLITLNGVLIFGFNKVEFESNSIAEKIGYWVLIPLAIISFFFALISLFPVLTTIEKGKYIKGSIAWLSNLIDSESKFENIHFTGHLKDLELDSFEAEYLTKTNSTTPFTQFEKDLSGQILHNARITHLKYQCFKVGAFTILIGVTLFVLAYTYQLLNI